MGGRNRGGRAQRGELEEGGAPTDKGDEETEKRERDERDQYMEQVSEINRELRSFHEWKKERIWLERLRKHLAESPTGVLSKSRAQRIEEFLEQNGWPDQS